jgi:hypothetical protein
MSYTVDASTQVALPSLPGVQLRLDLEVIERLTSRFEPPTVVLIHATVLDESGFYDGQTHPFTRLFQVSADVTKRAGEPPVVVINQVQIQQIEPRTCQVTLSEREVNSWLMPGKWLGIRNNGRLVKELRAAMRDAIAEHFGIQL